MAVPLPPGGGGVGVGGEKCRREKAEGGAPAITAGGFAFRRNPSPNPHPNPNPLLTNPIASTVNM